MLFRPPVVHLDHVENHLSKYCSFNNFYDYFLTLQWLLIINNVSFYELRNIQDVH